MKKRNFKSLNLNKKLISTLNAKSLSGGAEGNVFTDGTCNSCDPLVNTCKSCGDLCTSNDIARCPRQNHADDVNHNHNHHDAPYQ